MDIYIKLGEKLKELLELADVLSANDDGEDAVHRLYQSTKIHAAVAQIDGHRPFNKEAQLRVKLGVEIVANSDYLYSPIAYKNAIGEYNRAIEIDPDYAPAYYNRGLAYAELGDTSKAIEDWTKAIEIDPDYADAYKSRGDVYRLLDEYERALADYRRASDIYPYWGYISVDFESYLDSLEEAI
jgi:tetratricopeptide (TPR) repeat protein